MGGQPSGGSSPMGFYVEGGSLARRERVQPGEGGGGVPHDDKEKRTTTYMHMTP